MKDLYKTIGVDRNASADEIKKAFKDKAKELHPDKEGGDNDSMQQLTLAYDVLKNPNKRDRYDKTGETSDKSFETKFAEFVNSMFVAIIDHFEDNGQKIENIDLIFEFKNQISLVIDKNNELKEELNKKMSRLKRVHARLSSSKENRIGKALELNIYEFKKKIGKMDESIKFIRDCEEVISHHEYRFEPEEEIETPRWMNSGS